MQDEQRHSVPKQAGIHVGSFVRAKAGISDTSARPQVISFLIRILLIASSLLLLVVMRIPWVTLQMVEGDGVKLPLILGSIDGLRMVVFPAGLPAQFLYDVLPLLWDSILLVGLLLSLFLQRQEHVLLALVRTYGIWLLLTCLAALVSIYMLFASDPPIQCVPSCDAIRLVNREVNWGTWLTISVLALCWTAFIMYIRYCGPKFSAHSSVDATPIHFSSPRRVGASVYLFGAGLWALGLLVIPWTTAGCDTLQLSLNHFTRGACSGVDGFDVLTASFGSRGFLALPAIELALAMGVFAVAITWLPPLTRATCFWALSWSSSLTLLFFFGLDGVSRTLAHPPQFSYTAQEDWIAGAGVVVTAFGILFCWVGTTLICLENFRHHPQ